MRQGGVTISCPRATSALTLSHTELLQPCQGHTLILHGQMRVKLPAGHLHGPVNRQTREARTQAAASA